MDRFGPDNFSTLQIKGHVLHRARVPLKVPAWLLVWNALLTTGRIFSQPPLISFKRDKNIGNFL